MSTIAEIEAAIEKLPSAAVDELAAWLATLRIRRASPASRAHQSDWWDYLKRARNEAEAAGGPFQSQEAIEQERRGFRGDEESTATDDEETPRRNGKSAE